MVVQGLAHEHLVPAVAVDVEGVGVLAALVFALPEQLEVAAHRPEVAGPVLDDEIAPARKAGQVGEDDGIAAVKLAGATGGVLGCGRHPDPAFHPPGPPVQELELEVADEQHLVVPVAVHVVNLKGGVVGVQAVARVWPPGLPEHASVQGDGGEGADLVEGIARAPRHVLGDQHVDLAVTVEVAEADVASRSEAGGGESFPQPGSRVLRAQPGQLAPRAAGCCAGSPAWSSGRRSP